jgi:hypothetical protein
VKKEKKENRKASQKKVTGHRDIERDGGGEEGCRG